VFGIEVLLDVDDTVEDETTNEVVIEENKDSEEVLISSPWELDDNDAEENVIGVVVGIEGNTEELSSDVSPIVGSEDDFCTRLSDVLNVSVLVEYIVGVREDDMVDVVTLYILEDDVLTEDGVLSVEADSLDDDAMEDDIVVATTLDEVPLVVSVIILGDEEMVMYEVENVLNDSDTVVGVTVGTSVKLEEVVLISSPPIISMPSEEVTVTDVDPIVGNDDVTEELFPTTGLLVE